MNISTVSQLALANQSYIFSQIISLQFYITTLKSRKVVHKKMNAAAQRTVDLARERNYSIEKLLTFELVETNFLFDENGFFTKSNKSTLIAELEKLLQPADATAPVALIGLRSCYVVDVMACLRKLSMAGKPLFSNLAATFCEYVSHVVPTTTSRIDFIFDSYTDISPKKFERMRRGADRSINVHAINDDTPFPVQAGLF